MSSSSFPLGLAVLLAILIVCCLATPAHAFGAGNIPSASGIEGYNWRHGDITDVLLSLPISFITRQRFRSIDRDRVYFGNWMRDYSQLLDVGTLGLVPEPLLRAIVSVLGFLEFGYATREFDVTANRLGVYRPEEHIDNPKGYDGEARKVYDKLRGPVNPKEYAVNEADGMKNYIANETLGFDTSSKYIRRELTEAIQKGRSDSEDTRAEGMIHLGAALHCLEDFAAHSNYVELCLRLIGKHEPQTGLEHVFTYVGEANTTPTLQGPAPPVVTGTFGPLDLYQSILGEIDDKTAARNLSELDLRLDIDTSRIDSTAEALKIVLNGLTFLHIIPQTTIDTIDNIRNSSGNSAKQVADWGELNDTPHLLWDQIQPVFQLRDDISKWVSGNLSIPVVKDAFLAISDKMDQFVYAVLSVYLKPILGKMRDTLQQESNRLNEKAKSSSESKENDIFAAGSTASDPTHSQLAKDHFNAVLNSPAGKSHRLARTKLFN